MTRGTESPRRWAALAVALVALTGAVAWGCSGAEADPAGVPSASSATAEPAAPALPSVAAAPTGPTATPTASPTATPSATVVGGSLVEQRPYRLVEPAGRDPRDPAPLIVVLHGYGQGPEFSAYFGLDPVAAEAEALVAYPLGTPDALGRRFWNATEVCCDFFGSGIDDAAYLKAVIDDVSARRSVDSKRVYVVGYSNGAFMAQRLACELSGRIAAIVSVSGVNVLDAARCAPAEAVAVLQVHGDADPVVHYLGGRFGSGFEPYPSVMASIEGWRDRNGCEAEPNVQESALDIASALVGAETAVTQYTGCDDGGAAELWTVHGGNHHIDYSEAFGRAVWEFLAAHPKP